VYCRNSKTFRLFMTLDHADVSYAGASGRTSNIRTISAR
jgi:hypothetical protein